MIWTLQDVADYVATGRTKKSLLAIIVSVRWIFTFTHERANRLARFVKVVASYKTGLPVDEIVEKYGCSRQTVLRYARLAGCPKRPKGFNPDVRKLVIELYKSGRPIAEIQARCGVSQAYVSKTATEEGINRRQFRKRA